MKVNQQGFSLVEVMIGAGLLSALALGFASYTKHVNTVEAKTKVRGSLYQIELQALDYLKSRDTCNQLLGDAFKDKNILHKEVSGDYAPIKNKGYKDQNNNLVQKSVFGINDIYDGGRILLTGIHYKLKNLQEVSIPSSPWNVTGEMEIKISFQTCQDAKIVARPNGFDGVDKICPISQIKKASKVFTKFVSFQRDAAGKINSLPDPSGSGPNRLMANCADSQDAVIEASQEYTDLKSCISEIKMHALMARPVSTKCNIKLEVFDRYDSYYSNANVVLPPTVAPNTLKVILIGGGGGGGGGYGRKSIGKKREAGKAGTPGQYIEQTITDIVTSCKVEPGKGAPESDPGGYGKDGQQSKVTCGSFTATAAPGRGGQNKALVGHDHGETGPAASDPYGQAIQGSAGGNYANGRIPGRLGGGGGGGDAIVKSWTKYYSRGTGGGYGAVIFKYKALKVVDPQNLLDVAGETELKKLVTDPPVYVPQAPPLVAGSSTPEGQGPDNICSEDLSKEVDDNGQYLTPERIQEIREENNCPPLPPV